MHGGDLVEALEPFTIYGGDGAAEERAPALAVASGCPTSCAGSRAAAWAGLTTSAAVADDGLLLGLGAELSGLRY